MQRVRGDQAGGRVHARHARARRPAEPLQGVHVRLLLRLVRAAPRGAAPARGGRQALHRMRPGEARRGARAAGCGFVMQGDVKDVEPEQRHGLRTPSVGGRACYALPATARGGILHRLGAHPQAGDPWPVVDTDTGALRGGRSSACRAAWRPQTAWRPPARPAIATAAGLPPVRRAPCVLNPMRGHRTAPRGVPGPAQHALPGIKHLLPSGSMLGGGCSGCHAGR